MNMSKQSMSLSNLFDGFAEQAMCIDVPVLGLTMNSRDCIDNGVYFALAGLTTHGLNFVEDVLKKNVIAIVVCDGDKALTSELSERIQNICTLVTVKDLQIQLGDIAARFYGTNDSDCKVVAVTGTDGKTSVSHFVAQALNHKVQCAGVLGTAGWGFPGELTVSALTTPDVLEVHRQLFELRSAGAQYICMEVSSHALEQGRVNGLMFTAAVLTNLARDHLDFHGTLENYANAKRKLFFKENLQAVIINADDKFGQRLIADQKITAPKYSYGYAADSTYQIKSLSSEPRGLSIQSEFDGEQYSFPTSLLGGFNAYNVLAAWAVLETLGIHKTDIQNALASLSPVIGRMEMFTNSAGPTVVVDFAHTPQALELALSEVKKHCDGKLWCVFGCGGDRDKGKRSKMGSAASNYADYVIVTNDNPRTEDPAAITADILTGIDNPRSIEIILDREQAIRLSLGKAASNDWVVIAGKGHEDYQIFGTDRVSYSDRDLVQKVLREAV